MMKYFTNIISEHNITPSIFFEVGSRDCEQSVEFLSVFQVENSYAFEPNIDTIPICQKTARENNIKLVPCAICETNGASYFRASTTENTGYSSLLEPSGDYDCIEPMPYELRIVPTIRLDTFIDTLGIQPPDVIWIDAQGADLFVLKSLGRYVRNLKAVWCEAMYGKMYDGQCFADEIKAFGESIGLSVVYEAQAVKDWWGDICMIRK